MRVTLLIAIAIVVIVGCGVAAPSPAVQSGTNVRPLPSAPSQPPASQAAPGISIAMPSPGASVGEAVVVTTDLVLRVKPDPAADTTGAIPAGTNAWIAGATLQGGGTWYQLVPLDRHPVGWMAGWVFGPDSDHALTPIEFGCDSIGVSASLLAGLSAGSKLGCYSQPFTFAARIVDCNCDIDGGYVDPEWLGNSSVTGPEGQETGLLVDETETAPPPNPGDWLQLHLAPDAVAPDVLPFGQVVEITGQFDHPSAALCILPEGVEIGPDDPVLYCRTNLAVTAIGG